MVGRDIIGDCRACASIGFLTDFDRGNEDCVGAYENLVINNGFVLLQTVIVAGDGASADVAFAADFGVAKVCQVVSLRALADVRLLDLDEIPYLDLIIEHRTRP